MAGQTIVILGGSIAGLGIAHRLLKYTLPKCKDLKVVLVSKNSHFYWNVASVRAVIPGALKDEELLQPIEPGLAQYPANSVEFVLGAATAVDTSSKSVQVGAGDKQHKISYDYLVLATGCNTAASGLPWKASSSYEDLIENLHHTAQQIGAASHIVVAGGGATGVEVCAEIRHEFKGKKEVVLVHGAKELVGGDSVASSIEKELQSMGIVIKKGVMASKTEKQDDGKTKVTLDNGETIVTDLYLPTTGMTPNSDFLPAELLNEAKYVIVDDCMRVIAAENVWAAGDIVSRPFASYLNTEAQATCVAKNLDRILSGKEPDVPRDAALDTVIYSIGRNRGVGRFHSIPLPSLSVWAAKSRTLGVHRTKKYVNGTMW